MGVAAKANAAYNYKMIDIPTAYPTLQGQSPPSRRTAGPMVLQIVFQGGQKGVGVGHTGQALQSPLAAYSVDHVTNATNYACDWPPGCTNDCKHKHPNMLAPLHVHTHALPPP